MFRIISESHAYPTAIQMRIPCSWTVSILHNRTCTAEAWCRHVVQGGVEVGWKASAHRSFPAFLMEADSRGYVFLGPRSVWFTGAKTGLKNR